jgi:hypothetical protein
MAKQNDRVVDKRVVERNLEKGLISKADLEKHLAALPDQAANAEYSSYDDDSDDEDEDEDEQE